MLGSKRIGIYDNFLKLVEIQFLAFRLSLAKQAGLQLTPKQLFEHQTIAELAQVVKEEQGVQAEQGIITERRYLHLFSKGFCAKSS